VITLSLDDLDGSDQTRVLLENAKTKLILGLNQDSGAIARGQPAGIERTRRSLPCDLPQSSRGRINGTVDR